MERKASDAKRAKEGVGRGNLFYRVTVKVGGWWVCGLLDGAALQVVGSILGLRGMGAARQDPR